MAKVGWHGLLADHRKFCIFTLGMTAQQVRKVYDAQPFRPFTLCLADGRTLAVPHRDFFSMAPNGRTAIVWTGDAAEFVDLMLVLSLRVPGALEDAATSAA